MDTQQTPRHLPLHLAFFSLLTPPPQNAPLYVHCYTNKEEDEARYWQLSFGALDVIEEREKPTNKPAENFLGLLFTMDDLVIYGYRTASGVRIITGLALIDGVIKDSDVVMLSRAIHQLYISVTSSPFLPLTPTSSSTPDDAFGPPGIKDPVAWFSGSERMKKAAERLGGLVDGGRKGGR